MREKMMSFIRLPITLCSIAFLSGCAMTKENLALNYHLDANSGGILKVSHAEKVSVSVQDKRDVEDPRLIIHKQNMYNNVTSGGYLAEKPLANIVKEALSTGLNQMGYSLSNRSKYLFDCELIEVKPKYVMGWVQGTVGVQVELNIRVYNEISHAIVWQDIIRGHGSVITAWGGNDTLKAAFNKALTNAIRQLQNSKSLTEILN
jgi:hypothetical protein